MHLRKKTGNQGAALIMAIIVSLVIMAFVLSLLMVAFTLYTTVQHSTMEMKCQELAKSVSDELREEITLFQKLETEGLTNDGCFENYLQQKAAMDSGTYNLWFYLRHNIWTDAWPYYNEESKETGHAFADSKRVYHMKASGASDLQGIAEDIAVELYWKSDKETYRNGDKDGVELYVVVKVNKGDAFYSITSAYHLQLSSYVYPDAPSGAVQDNNAAVNPDNNGIVAQEIWKWIYDGRMEE